MITVESTKEEVGNFIVSNLKLKEDIKAIIIKEDISGDVLLDLTEDDFKYLKIKVVQMRKIKAFIDQNKAKFGEKKFTEVISIYSDSNEVAEFFKKSLNFEGNLNDLDGKALLELTAEGINGLGLTLGQRKRLLKYIDYFKTLKVEPPKELKITKESTAEEVIEFFKKKLKFSEEDIKLLTDLGIEGGDSLLILEESDIENCGLTNEKILDFKNIIDELKKEEPQKEPDIIITEESDKETIEKYFKIKLKISEKGIDAIINGLGVEDGGSYLLLETKDIDGVDELTEEEKIKLKEDLIQRKPKVEKEIIISKESPIEEVRLFLEKKLNISEQGIKAIEDLGVENGENLFSLELEDIDNTKELNQEEKDNLKNFLKQKKEEEEKNKKKDENDIKDVDNNDNINNPKSNEINTNAQSNQNNINDKKDNEKKEKVGNKVNIDNNLEYNNGGLKYNNGGLKDNNGGLKDNNGGLKDNNADLKDNNDGLKNNNNILRGSKNNLKDNNIILNDTNTNNKLEPEINPAYEGEVSDKVLVSDLKDFQINPFKSDSKFNIFFILSIKDEDIDYTKIGTFVDKTGFFSLSNTYMNLNSYIIYKNSFKNTKDDRITSFIFQVPMNKQIKKLIVYMSTTKMFNDNAKYTTDIILNDDITNYFYIFNLNNDITIKTNRIFAYYFDYFLTEKNQIKDSIQKSLIKGLINKIKYQKNILLKPNIILIFLSYCKKFKLEPKNIDNIELYSYDGKIILEKLIKDYLISSDDIDSLTVKNNNEKNKLINLIVKIYAFNNSVDNLIKLIESKNGIQCSKTILDLLNNKEIKFENLTFEKEEDYLLLKKNLLFSAKTKEDINFIIKMSRGLVDCLQFIDQFAKEIYEILKKCEPFRKKTEHYQLKLPEPKIEDDIEILTQYLKKIFEIGKEYKLINLEDLFVDLKNIYLNKSIEELCKLNLFVDFLRSQNVKDKILEDYYISFHTKGINLIKKGDLNTEQIILFMKKQDAYYFKDNFKKSNLRDPIIFKYIPITKKENDDKDEYLKNIQLIKDNKLWELYNEPCNLQTKFFSIILEQIEFYKDFKSIFEIFPIKYINQNLAFEINRKVNDIKYTLLDEKEENYELLFDVFTSIIKVNEYNNLDLNYIVKLIQFNYELTAKYYFHILKDKNMTFTVNNIKNIIINFFIDRNREGKISAESFITLLLLSDKHFSQVLLNQMNTMIATEIDFYQKEETPKFLLFKLFFEKCGDLIIDGKLADGTYLVQSLDIKNKMKDNFFNYKIKYDLLSNLLADENSFYKKLFVVFDEEEKTSKQIHEKIKGAIQECLTKFETFEKILDYLNTFYSNTKKDLINSIKNSLNTLKQWRVNEILKLDEKNFIRYKGFNLEELKEQSKNLKYKNSLFFMDIYRRKIENEILEKLEDDIFKESIVMYKDSLTRIINQKETKEPFFNIKYVNEFMAIIQNNNMDKEIEFILNEFAELGRDDYIKKELLNDLINFSNKTKVVKLVQGIIYFLTAYNKIKEIQNTNFLNDLKSTYDIINTNEVSGEEIKKAIDLLNKYEYDIKKETSLIKFYELLLGKEEAITFIKKIKDSNLEIRNLNEFIDEVDGSQLQTTDIDNLMDVYIFFNKLLGNENIKTDEQLLVNFKKEYDKDKDIPNKLQGYLNSYGEIIQLFQLYDENPEMTIQKIDNILSQSLVNIFKDKKTDLFIFEVEYKNKKGNVVASANEIDELRNKILLSSSNTNILQKEGGQIQKKMSKEIITHQFINLFDNIRQLMNSLNSLQSTGYPSVVDFSLKIIDSKGFDENDMKKDLEQITTYYEEINNKYKRDLKKGYEEHPLLRLFYGKQFIQLHKKSTNKNTDISHLLNSVTLNKIKDTNIDYPYNYEINSVENINKYLQKLFKVNKLDISELYKNNKVLPETSLSPGLYRKIKSRDFSDLINKVLNIYLNLTGNLPIINTLLICNENTDYEQVKSFLYKAIYCDDPILFVIANLECLELSIIQKIIKRFKYLYKKKNNKINSYLIFLYEKIDSAFARDIERIIPEKNILNDKYLVQSENKDDCLNNIELYHAKYSGYGKTTEIINKVKDIGGEYHYLPIGGSFTRDFVINNIENLKINMNNIKNVYLHLDLSDTDNNDLMSEVLFELIILRYLISNNKIFYLGYDMNIIIEIPQGFVDYLEKYRILTLFKRVFIEKLNPLRLENNVQYIRDSPISIVAEVLSLYENNKIDKQNVDLDSKIKKSASECEKIINRHFQVENQNYYQKMNFIKILSVQFKKFLTSLYLPPDDPENIQDPNRNVIRSARVSIIKNFIELSKVFTQSPFDTVLLKQIKSMKIFGKYEEDKAVQEGIDALADENAKKKVFSFEQIKPSLVFFNQDGQSFSIISNNNKNEKEYKDLKALWNSQKYNQNEWEDLVDYKNMNHEKFLEQIQKLFSLDEISIEKLKTLCEKLGNYIFVADNFIKMVRILLNIEAKIPVILMGETGVGKTKLLEMLATLYGHGNLRWERLQIHAGTTDEKIVSFLEEVNQKVEKDDAKDKITWIFFDEINTCNSLGLITEIMCNHTYLGKKLNKNYVFLGACNPYRILTKKMRESGLVY